ncbi:flavodoxin family protein [Pseudoteredinibacter isoporae]|uniref:flavodoxin family protein n=1 Tax=Pseudoteredinibacter isoporae TaxID=570281 RepID=UPI00333F2210
MAKLLIIYHSQTGNTEQLALAAQRGAAKERDCELRVKRAFDAKLEDLLWCDGVLFGSPENFGYMCGAIKDFFDRTFYPAEPYELNLPYGLLVSAGNDGSGAVREMDRILCGYPMKKVLPDLIAKGEIQNAHLQQAEENGEAFASGLCMGIF